MDELTPQAADYVRVLIQEALRSLEKAPPSAERMSTGRALINALDLADAWSAAQSNEE